MQKKIGTVLDSKLFEDVKAISQKEHTSLSNILEEAISDYLKKKRASGLSFSTVEASFGTLRVSPKALKIILEEDIYETD